MKRLLLGLLLLLGARSVWAAQPGDVCTCQPASTCTASAPCKASAVGTWTGTTFGTCGNNCGGTTPDSNDTVYLYPDGRAVMDDLDNWTIAGLNIAGSDFSFDPDTSNRGADGIRTLIVAGNIALQSNGAASPKIHLRKNDEITLSTAGGVRQFLVQGGLSGSVDALFDGVGDVYQTVTMAATAAVDSGNVCGSGANRSELFTITVPAGATTHAIVGGRVVFQSGPMVRRQFEIVSISGNAITFCSHKVDAAAGLQRLTPHQARGFTPTWPAAQHSVPDPGGNAGCSGVKTPDAWCTGAGTGGGYLITPTLAGGDQVALVQDWRVDMTGANGFTFQMTGARATNWPIFTAGNISGIVQGAGAACLSVTASSSSVTATSPSYMNIHDNDCASGDLVFNGARNTTWQWDVFHDDVGGAAGGNAAQVVNMSTLDANGNTIVDSVFYRNRTGAMAVGGSSFSPASTGLVSARNLIYDCCTSTTAVAMSGITMGNAIKGQVTGNLIMYGERKDFPGTSPNGPFVTQTINGIVFTAFAGSTGLSAVADHNTILNWMGEGITTSCAGTELANTMATGNYFSHLSGDPMNIVGAIGNVVRDWGLIGNGDAIGLQQVAAGTAKSNFMLLEQSVANSADCSLRGCTRGGIKAGDFTHTGTGAVTVTDNIVAGLYDNFSVLTSGGNYQVCSFCTISGSPSVIGNLTMTHNVVDGRGNILDLLADENAHCNVADDDPVTCCNNPAADACGPLVPDFSNYAFWLNSDCNGGGACTRTDLLKDNYVIGTNNIGAVVCTHSTAGQTRTLTNNYRLVSGNAIWSSGIPTGTDCAGQTVTPVSNVDGYVASIQSNYQLQAGSALLTAASDGGSIGPRAFNFQYGILNGLWGGSLRFDGEQPRPFSNSQANTDTDGDGVMDFLPDNCPLTWNPSQLDSDGDGKGDACDASP